MESNDTQREENYRGYLNLLFNITEWLTLTVKGDMNRGYTTYESKRWAWRANKNYEGARYLLNEKQKLQYKGSAMLTAAEQFGDFSVSASLAAERFHEDQSFHNSQTNNGLRTPGVFELNNSVNAATTDAYARIRQRRINSVYGFINADWKGQVYLDITGRNDWSSTLRYSNGSGNVSYFYPSVSASWILTQTLRDQLPAAISFFKLRGSYAIVGKDCDPYLITDPGSYEYHNTYQDSYFGDSGRYAYYRYANSDLGALDLMPEKQHAIEFGIDLRMFDNRLGFDIAYYRTNTKNQILKLPTSTETGVSNRIINAGNIQNQGVEALVRGTIVKTKDLFWEVSFNYTLNRNKIVELYPGVTRYKLLSGSDVEAWATEGGTYGDLYSPYAYKRNAAGMPLINAGGQFIRSSDQLLVGNSLPKFLGGFSTDLHWKSFSFGAIIDARFGGQIWSGSYNYGMSSGSLKGSLRGRTTEYGGLPRTLADGRTINDGMLPEGVFEDGVKAADGTDLSGMSAQEAYEKGFAAPLPASMYYDNLYNWGNGIREAAILDISWVALRELSLYWTVPQKWTEKFFIKGATLGFAVRNVGYLHNSLPDHIHPEGLKSNLSAEFTESGGNVYSRNYSFKINLNF
jgi:iron complex outermembrane receptor protein